MENTLFPTRLMAVPFCIRALAATAVTVIGGLVSLTFLKDHFMILAGLWIAGIVVLKYYYLRWILAPRLKDIGIEPIYAVLAILPPLGLIALIGGAVAPSGSWQPAPAATLSPPSLPGQIPDPSPRRQENPRIDIY